ncbi:hypothetical protein EDD86DRAFT_216429 [Gorgonomyces haynaldii]|nr:hypothetical protein EDD86DRAFT_216429 [Gorgonomyces haynaldii]
MRSWNTINQVLKSPTNVGYAAPITNHPICKLLRDFQHSYTQYFCFFKKHRLLSVKSVCGTDIGWFDDHLPETWIKVFEKHGIPTKKSDGQVLEIDGSDCKYRISTFGSQLDKVQRLLPNKTLGFKLQKIQMILPGGSVDPSMKMSQSLGTMILGFPGSSVGGELVLTVDGQDVVIDKHHGACFVPGTPFRFQPVLKGHAITFHFDLLESAAYKYDSFEPDVPQESPIVPFGRSQPSDGALNPTTIGEELIQQLKTEQHPKTRHCLMLLQSYKFDISIDDLHSNDKALFHLLRQHFQVSLGLCVNRFRYYRDEEMYGGHPHYSVVDLADLESLDDIGCLIKRPQRMFVGLGGSFQTLHLSDQARINTCPVLILK